MDDAAYWDTIWEKRTYDDAPLLVEMNKEKLKFLIKMLSDRPYYRNLAKLDVGCGTGIHAVFMEGTYPGWIDNYFGIDLSEVGIAKAHYFGLNAQVHDFYSLKLDRKVEAFLFLDSLEHFGYHKKVVDKIHELAAVNYYIFGNIPLYQTTSHADDCHEWPVDRQTLVNLFGSLGFTKFWQRIYGSYGYPYMVFEGRKYGKIGDENTGNLSTS